MSQSIINPKSGLAKISNFDSLCLADESSRPNDYDDCVTVSQFVSDLYIFIIIYFMTEECWVITAARPNYSLKKKLLFIFTCKLLSSINELMMVRWRPQTRETNIFICWPDLSLSGLFWLAEVLIRLSVISLGCFDIIFSTLKTQLEFSVWAQSDPTAKIRDGIFDILHCEDSIL